MTRRLLSLFSGCGGLDLGFEQAGFAVPLAIDIDPLACATYNLHHSGRAVVGDLSIMAPRMISALWESRSPGAPPIGIIGGPPCQFFSKGNVHRNPRDIRRKLPVHYARILASLNRKYRLSFFLFENVGGLTRRVHQRDYERILTLFGAAGFVPFIGLLDAQFYGVPQTRPRVFVVGFNKALRGVSFEFPTRITSTPLTVRSVLDTIKTEPIYFSRLLHTEEIAANYHANHWTMQPRSRRFREGTVALGKNKGRSFRVLDPDKPSRTVAYGNRELHIHPQGHRRVSILEAMLFQGFPKDYVLLGNFSQQVRQVSDAVPPPLAAALGESILQSLDTADSQSFANPSGVHRTAEKQVPRIGAASS